jgi:hypothetical protein
MYLRQQFPNPPTATPLGVAPPNDWGYHPLVTQNTIGDMTTVNPSLTIEPLQCQGLPQSHGDPNRATNGQGGFIVRHPKGQKGDTISQAMAAMRRAIARGSEPSADELVQFLQQETSSYTCLCSGKSPCGKRFERRHRAVDHVRGHFGLRIYPCRGGCGKKNW